MNIEKKRISIAILSLQVVFLILVSLGWLGLELIILRQVVGFLYLTFVPGFLLLGLIGLDNLRRMETILYSIGLSLSFLCFIGTLINYLYPLIGINNPISEIPLTITIIAITSVLYHLYSLQSREYTIFSFNKIQSVLFSSAPILLLLPILSIFGGYLFNYYNINFLILILYVIISTFPIFIAFDKFPKHLFAPAIWAISISLLFSITLSIKNISYGDALLEYNFANLVISNGIWNPSIIGPINAMLSIVMIHPIYSILLDTRLKDVFIFIYPLLYSFTPLVLYVAFKREMNEIIAFFSSFFFMSLFSFYVIFSRCTRSGIAELFLALFILSVIDKDLPEPKKSLLSIVFALSIIVSHYGTSYMLMFALVISIPIFVLVKFRNHKNIESSYLNFSVLYITSTLAWYIYISGGSSFTSIVKVIHQIMTNIPELFTIGKSYTLSHTFYALYRDWSLSVRVSRDLLLVTSVFILIAVMCLIRDFLKGGKIEFNEKYSVLSVSFIGIILSTFLPAKGYTLARVYHISLCFLAPFTVIGFMKLLDFFKLTSIRYLARIKIFSLFLVMFFLFNSGFVSETLIRGNDYSPNILISKSRALNIEDAQYILSYGREIIYDTESSGAEWLMENKEETAKIYLDWYSGELFLQIISRSSNPLRYARENMNMKGGYIYLRTYNVRKNLLVNQYYPPTFESIFDIYPLNKSNKVYTNGENEIYYYPNQTEKVYIK